MASPFITGDKNFLDMHLLFIYFFMCNFNILQMQLTCCVSYFTSLCLYANNFFYIFVIKLFSDFLRKSEAIYKL